LELLLDAPDRSRPDPPAAPDWVRNYFPFMGRFWGDGLTKIHKLTLNKEILDWAHIDPPGLLHAAETLANSKEPLKDIAALRLSHLITSDANQKGAEARRFFLERLLAARPDGLVEGTQILVKHRDDVVKVMTRQGYTDPLTIGGYLDRDLPDKTETIALKESAQ
jgi:hypothetical protein